MLALSSQSFAKDFGNYSVDLEVGGSANSWDSSGSDNNSARFAGYADLDLVYRFNDAFSVTLENGVIEEEDENHDLAYSFEWYVTYQLNNFDINPGVFFSDTNNDVPADGNQQVSFAQLEVGYTIPNNGARLSIEYSDEASDGSTNGTDRWVETIVQYKAEKTFDAPFGYGKNLVTELVYTDFDNLRETYALDLEYNITDNYGVGFVVGENDGKGPFANNVGQNRDFADLRVFLKY